MVVENKESLIVKTLWDLINEVPISKKPFDFYWKNYKDSAKKEKTASAIRTDMLRISKIFESAFYPKWMIALEDYHMSAVRRSLELKKKNQEWFSNAKQPIIRTFVDRLLKWIVKANFWIKVRAVSPKYKNQVDSVQTAIEWAFASAKGKSKIQDIASSAILNGNWFAKASFSTPAEKWRNIENPETKEYVRIEKDYAKLDWVSEFDLYYEPTEPLRWAQQFVAYRTIKPLKSILKWIAHMDEIITPEHLVEVLKSPKPFLQKDYDQSRLIKYYEDMFSCDPKFVSMDAAYRVAWNNDKVEYVEIWTPDTLTVCINGYIVADQPNPYADRDQWHPFFSSHYTKCPWVSVAEWIWILLWDVQRWYDSLFNLLLDQAMMTASPMIMLSAWQSLNMDDSDTVFKWKRWWIFLNPSQWDIRFLTPPSVDQWVITVLQNMLEMAQFNVAPATYADYNTQSRSAQDSQLRFEWLSDTIALFVDSMSNMLNEIAQAWLLDMQKKMPEFFELPIFDKEWTIKDWKKMKRSDLEWEYIFEWASESIKDVNTLVERAQLPELINSLQGFILDDNGRSIIDKWKFLEYICNLYWVDKDVILTKTQIDNNYMNDVMNQAKAEQSVAMLQAETQQALAPAQPEEQEIPVDNSWMIPQDAMQEQQAMDDASAAMWI